MPSAQLTDAQGRWFLQRRPIPRRDEGIAKVVEREQRPVRLSDAKADAILPAKLLQQKLGKSTFRLYSVLLTMRNEECETHPSLPGLVKATGLGAAQLEKSLARLRLFGLVKDRGFTYLRVPCRCDPELGSHLHKVYLRKVYGVLKSTPDGQTQNALVPRETARLVKEAAGQGGVRPGAGRPKGTKDSAPRKTIKGGAGKSNVGAYKYQEPISSESLSDSLQKCGVSLRVQSKNTERAGKERKNPLRYPAPILWGCSSPSQNEVPMPSTIQTKAQPSPSVGVFRPTAPAPAVATAPAGDLEVEVDGVRCGFEALFTQGAGAKMIQLGGGGSRRRRQQYTPEDMRAATELSNQIDVLRVPAPPKISEDLAPEKRLALLKAAYRAAHEKVMRAEYWRPSKAQTERERELLLEAAQALLAENISPTAWARFSYYQWQEMGKKTAPSPKWVWSAKRIHEHAGWCHEATGTLNTAHPIPLPAVTTLMRRLQQIRQQLGYGRPTADVVSGVLPDAERRKLLQQQADQRVAGQRDIEQRIRNGEWVWG